MGVRKVIRTLFGDVDNNVRLRNMVHGALANEQQFLKENPELEQITYFVLGDKNVQYLKDKNVKNIVKISDKPDVRPYYPPSFYGKLHGKTPSHPFPEFPIYYNKTYLANEAFKYFGKDSEIVLLDMDVKIFRWPNERMWELWHMKKDNLPHFQSALRIGYRHNQRIPPNIADNGIESRNDGVHRNLLLMACVIYCNDYVMWQEYLDTYEELYARLRKNPWYYWVKRGITTPMLSFHDEHVLTYWFDKKFGEKTIPEIVDMIEANSIFKMDKMAPEAKILKKSGEIYFKHKG